MEDLEAQAGDLIEVRRGPGRLARRGRIEEVLGEPPHIRYYVRWDEGIESIVYAGSEMRILATHAPAVSAVE